MQAAEIVKALREGPRAVLVPGALKEAWDRGGTWRHLLLRGIANLPANARNEVTGIMREHNMPVPPPVPARGRSMGE